MMFNTTKLASYTTIQHINFIHFFLIKLFYQRNVLILMKKCNILLDSDNFNFLLIAKEITYKIDKVKVK